MSSLKLVVAEYFDGIIWRMEIDSKNHTLFAEIRNVENRRVSFAAISLESGKVFFKNYTTDENWLTGIEAAYDGVMLLHFYQNASAPTHKGLAAIEAETSTMLWHNFNLAFDFLTVNGPLFFDSRIQPPKKSLGNIKTGDLIRGYESALDAELVNEVHIPRQNVLPENFPSLPVEPYSNNVHYLEYGNLIIVSLHALWMGQLRQYLFIAKDTELIFEDILNTDIQKLQPEAFVLYRNQLIYLKEKSEIKVLNL